VAWAGRDSMVIAFRFSSHLARSSDPAELRSPRLSTASRIDPWKESRISLGPGDVWAPVACVKVLDS